jgi:hypothetical protein
MIDLNGTTLRPAECHLAVFDVVKFTPREREFVGKSRDSVEEAVHEALAKARAGGAP